jgi:hypothetical protein
VEGGGLLDGGGSGAAHMEACGSGAVGSIFFIHDSSPEHWRGHVGGEKGAVCTNFFTFVRPDTFIG